MNNMSDVLSVFQQLAWDVSKDSVGDRILSFRLTDNTQITGAPAFRKLPNSQLIESCFGVSFDFLDSVITKIEKKRKVSPWHVCQGSFKWKKDFFNESDIVSISNELLEWAKQQNVEDGLSIFRNYPTDSVGNMPLKHLGALAIAKDVNKLSYYLESFKAGDRLGFVPYITQDFIERALKIAEE
ncbi:MAG: hypothetical protein Q7T48_12950 [Cellvibrio sp.]|uniref:DUF6990 domain-containing protein n=1 Tax=Cellvibrio sp. TaxID=1965322 RepID=UPI002725666A|nr:hypothetical protein [Cellvibrio sp.]